MKKTILLSGLCAEEQLYCKLHLKAENPVLIHWVQPSPDDTLGSYAEKLLPQINLVPGDTCVLVGISFGGMIAIELAKRLPAEKTIIISSLADPENLPLHYKLGGKLGLQQVLPWKIARQIRFLADYIFGAETPEEKKILHNILDNADIDYARWAMTQIVNWQHKGRPENLVQIHGSDDMLLPWHPHPDQITLKGGHLLVLHSPDEVSEIVNRHL
jgi:pimeloyl-ACP methyl ester carboxylesterase